MAEENEKPKTEETEEQSPKTEESSEQESTSSASEESSKEEKEVLSVKEIDELYDEIKRAADSGSTDSTKEKELVRKAIEAERKRQQDTQSKVQSEQEKQQMKKTVEDLKKELEELKNTSVGRKSQVPTESPFQRNEDNRVKIPKAEMDKAIKDWVKNLGK